MTQQDRQTHPTFHLILKLMQIVQNKNLHLICDQFWVILDEILDTFHRFSMLKEF